MASIQEYLDLIKNAIYGKDVRQAIHDGIQQCYYDGKAGSTDLEARQRLDSAEGSISSLGSRISTAEGDIDTLDARVDQIVAPSGEAPSAAEVADGRVVGGVTYNSIGDAIRAVDTNAKNYSESVVAGGNMPVPLHYIDGGYVKPNDGQISSYGTWKYTDYVYIGDAEKIYVTATVQTVGSIEYNAFYDTNKNFISSFSVTDGEVNCPDGACYVRMSIPKDPAFIQTLAVPFEGLIKGAVDKKQLTETVTNLKENSLDDSFFIKAQLEFEAGGISMSTGQDYDGEEQKNRLRSKFAHAERDYKLFQTVQLPVGNQFIWYRVFYWDTDDSTQNPSRLSDWYRFPDAPTYVIPKDSYFRILIYSEQYTSPITDVKASFVYNHFDIMAIMVDFDSTNVIELNKDVLPFIQSLPTTYPSLAKTYFGATHTPLTFAHFSDIHNKPELWERIVEYVDANAEYLPFALHTGDYVGDNQTSYTDLYNYAMPTVPFLNCVGNHDTYADAQHTLATKQSTYDKLFNHTSNWGVTFDNDISYSMTYYKDFPSSNIRLIVFDNYYDIADQKTWLTARMNEAKSLGYSVVTASHQVTGKPTQKISCTFQTLIPYDTVAMGAVLNTEFDAVIGDFIRNGGKHIVHICGHEHVDWFFKTANGVLNCAVNCATDFLGWSEGARVINTKTMDCFNAVGIDADLGTIKLVRIGANADSHNRAKNILSYDYVNDIVLFNE